MMKADWTSQTCPSCGARLRSCCDSALGDSHMTNCPKLGPFPEAHNRPRRGARLFPFTRLQPRTTP